MKKMKKRWKEFLVKILFWAGSMAEGKFRGQVPYTEAMEPLGYREGQKLPEKLKNCYKMDINEQKWKEYLN